MMCITAGTRYTLPVFFGIQKGYTLRNLGEHVRYMKSAERENINMPGELELEEGLSSCVRGVAEEEPSSCVQGATSEKCKSCTKKLSSHVNFFCGKSCEL